MPGATSAPLVGDGWNPFAFTGHELDDETGLYYAKARFYDPEIGLFLSEDPHLGAPDAPPSLHRYLYAYQNPTVYIDPDGRIVTQLLGGVVSTAVGFGIAKLTGQDYDLKDAAIDFTLGAATSGLSVASKIGKVGKFAAEAALDVGAEATRQFIEEGEIDAGALAKGAVMNAIIGEAGARIGGRVARRLGFDGGGSTGPRGPPTETKVKSVVTGESGSAPGVSAAQVNGQKSVAPTRSRKAVDEVAGSEFAGSHRAVAQPLQTSGSPPPRSGQNSRIFYGTPSGDLIVGPPSSRLPVNYRGEKVVVPEGHVFSQRDLSMNSPPIFEEGPFTAAQRAEFLDGRAAGTRLAPHHRGQLPTTFGGVIDEIPAHGHPAGNQHLAGSPTRHPARSIYRRLRGGERLRKDEIEHAWNSKGRRLVETSPGNWEDPGPP